MTPTDNRMPIPEGLLEADRVYYWSVSADLNGEPSAVYAGRFSTATRLCDDVACVAPASLLLGPESLLNGAVIKVSVAVGHTATVLLPRTLTADGADGITVSGQTAIVVKPSTRFGFEARSGHAASSSAGEIRVRHDRGELRVAVAADPSKLGAYVKAVKSGFDPVADTPIFTNFAGGVLSGITKGTCLGMVLAVKSHYMDCATCSGRAICSCMRLRLRSLVEPDSLRSEMNYMHLANLDPQNWSVALASVVGAGDGIDVVAEIVEELKEGAPVVVALVSPGRGGRDGNAAQLGHAVLVYEALEFEDYYLFQAYDPDDAYETGSAQRAFLLARKGSAGAARFQYGGTGAFVPVDVFTVSGSHLLSALAPIISDTYSELDGELAEKLRR